jgi:hypoxanthine phosphoribosyltransferase
MIMRYKTVYDEFRVKGAILKLSSQVIEYIEELGAENCVLIPVLSGGLYLFNKIIDRMPKDMLAYLETSVIKVSSYHGRERKEVREEVLYDPVDCSNKTLIIIDDFCDSGSTINALNRIYKNRYGASDVIFVTLLARDKKKLDEDVTLLYGILDKTDNFYIGCGMDDEGKSRFIDKIIVKVEDETEAEHNDGCAQSGA